MINVLNKTVDTLNVFASNLRVFIKNTKGREKTDQEIGQIALKCLAAYCVLKTVFTAYALLGAISLSPPLLGLLISKVAYTAMWGVLSHDMIQVDNNIQNRTVVHAVKDGATTWFNAVADTAKALWKGESTDVVAEEIGIELTKTWMLGGVSKNTLVLDPLLNIAFKCSLFFPQD